MTTHAKSKRRKQVRARALKRDRNSVVRWKDAAERWLRETKKLSKSKDEYMLAWIGQHIDAKELAAVDGEVIEELRKRLGKQGSSKSTIDRYMALMRSILHKCRDQWGYLVKIPKVPRYGQKLGEPRWLSRAEFAFLRKELPPHLKVAAEFAVLTGIPMRSMLQLTWDRVDLTNRRAWVPTTSGEFAFPLSRAAIRVLKKSKTYAPKGDRVFQYRNRRGELHSLDDCNTAAFHKACRRAGLEGLRWLDLRHTFAAWAVRGGVSLDDLMRLGNWKSFEMVRRYEHLASDRLSQAAELVGRGL
jgi:integrase